MDIKNNRNDNVTSPQK